MGSVNFLRLSLYEIKKELEIGSITSFELVKLCFKRIKLLDNEIGAFLALNEENSLMEARNSDIRRIKNQLLSNLDGIPVAVKDMIMTKGIESTAGSKILEGFIPTYDATVIENLKKNGLIILGKLNQDEFAMGSSNEMSAYGICKNPLDLNKSPGGSSGGSAAAVSASFCFAALGTDTGGSIRQPASFCGIVGIKPTYGSVSRFGVASYASSLDQVGVLAKDVKSAALTLESIFSYDERDSTSVKRKNTSYLSCINNDLDGLVIGLPDEYFDDDLNADVKSAINNSIILLKKSGVIFKRISLPHTKYAVATYYIISCAEASSNLSRYDGIHFGPRIEDINDSLESVYSKTRGFLFGLEVKRRIILGTYVLSSGCYDDYYLRAQKVRSLISFDFKNAFNDVDIILAPTTPTSAFKIGEKITNPLKMYLNDVFTVGSSLSGLPALSLNSGFCSDSMPIGIQIIGNYFKEDLIFNVAYGIEEKLKLMIK